MDDDGADEEGALPLLDDRLREVRLRLRGSLGDSFGPSPGPRRGSIRRGGPRGGRILLFFDYFF